MDLIIRIPLDLKNAESEDGLTDLEEIHDEAMAWLASPASDSWRNPALENVEEAIAESLAADRGIWAADSGGFSVTVEGD